ncbi:hypothetical protein MMC07_008386 [Pseudocyphellaria aurata]|nr:hypothetical protein [Pseudocyphellaria aurata]
MVLLAYSSAALLTCGSLVFGRPLRTQSEKRDLTPFTYTPSSNIDPTSGISLGTTPNAPLPFTTLNVPTTPGAVPGTSWTSAQPPKLPLQNTYLETAFLDPNAPSLSPASQQLPRVGAPTNYPLYSFDAGGDSNTFQLELSDTPLPPDFIPALPKDFHELLLEMYDQKSFYTYHIFRLSANKRNLEVTTSGKNDGSFRQALLDAEPGFAIHSILTDEGLQGLLVLTNFHHLCEANQPDGLWKEVSKCADDRRQFLNNILFNTWFKAIEQVFPESNLRLEDEVTVYCHNQYNLKLWSSPDIDDSMAKACPPTPY